MSLVKSTGWLSIVDGGSTPLPIDVANIVSARLRWRGKEKRLTDSDSDTGNYSATFPSVPEGWTRSSGSASFSIRVITGDREAAGTVSVSAPGGSKTTGWTVDAYSSKTVSSWWSSR